MIKVGVAGYGVIGQRLADGVVQQKDMELVGVADIAPTLAVRALKEKGIDLILRDIFSYFFSFLSIYFISCFTT